MSKSAVRRAWLSTRPDCPTDSSSSRCQGPAQRPPAPRRPRSAPNEEWLAIDESAVGRRLPPGDEIGANPPDRQVPPPTARLSLQSWFGCSEVAIRDGAARPWLRSPTP